MATRHRSTAFVDSYKGRGPGWKSQPVSEQVRFIVRLASACHDAGVEYHIRWEPTVEATPRMKVSIIAIGDIPAAKKLVAPKAITLAGAWKPKQWEAEYRLEAHHTTARMVPAMVIPHSSGLGLIMPCASGEWGTGEGDADPNGKWFIAHLGSGKGFGMELPLSKAAAALSFAASSGIDWTLPVEELQRLPGFQRAGLTVRETFGRKATRIEAAERLSRMAA